MTKTIDSVITYLGRVPIIIRAYRYALKMFESLIRRTYGSITYYHYDPSQKHLFDVIQAVRKENELLITDIEAFMMMAIAKSVQKIQGDFAEVGVYKGGSALLLCEVKGNKKLHLFDTFEGLPDLTTFDNKELFCRSQFLAQYEEVKKRLSKHQNITINKGLFPSTAEYIKNETFSFVNLDVDLYESTKSCLEFFYPRMNHGGVIMSHDYVDSIGVRKAFDEYFSDNRECIFMLPSSQCMVVKIS